MASPSDLTRLPAFDKETSCWHAVIETPQGSHHKFAFAPTLGCFELKKTLPQGMTFPLDFGFIPSTLGEDGDPLDVLVLLDFPASMGALVKVRLIGGIQAKQKEQGEDWIRNDRLIAVAANSKTLAEIKALGNLRPEQLDQLTEFFKQYLKLEGQQFQPLENCDARQAAALIEIGIKKFKKAK
jgi:inorganic pyrophosphatase